MEDFVEKSGSENENPLQDWYKLFVELLFKYSSIMQLRSDSQLGPLAKKAINDVFPNWDKCKCIMDSIAKQRKTQLKEISNFNSEFYFMTKEKGTELLSLIYHLRNAIAHGNVAFDNSYVVIKDYVYNHETKRFNKTPTAYLKIKGENLKRFIQIILSQVVC